MCRLVAYSGVPVFLERLLVDPKTSLMVQSIAAREAKTIVNADGCGVGWYGELEQPAVYRGILPAWSDPNLACLCRQIRSRLFLAHVRSATSGEIAIANCHPFTAARHLFMHNGQVGEYDRLRRSIDLMIPDAFYPLRRGTSDSEAIFLAALGHGLDGDADRAVAHTLSAIVAASRAVGTTSPIRFSAIHSDGETIRAWRWASDNRPPSLYWRRNDNGVTVASEPFDDEADTWHALPNGGTLEVRSRGTLTTGQMHVA